MTEDQQTSSYVNMVKEDISNELMNLAIKFICLLTGENCAVVMKTSVDDNAESRWEPESTSMKERQNPVTVHPLPFMTLEGQTKKKILEVTQKIIELMTDEVPIRCHNVTVYFSMEEWEYLEGHKDLYKDVMMEDEPDGSRKRNPPQRCPPTRDSTQEDLPIPHHNQYEEQIYMNVEFKEEEEEVRVTENHPPAEKNEMMAIKKEESTPDISTNESTKKNPIEGCPCPQGEDLIYIKGKVKEEETYTSVYHPCMEEVGMAIQSNLEGCSSDIKTDSWKASAEESQCVLHQSTNKSRHYLCPQCGKSFTIKGNFQRHLKIHTSERPYSCSECGKRFTQKEYLVIHQKRHANVGPFPCSECGKHFQCKTHLVIHMRVHTGERPFSCSECGKSYSEKGKLSMHQRLHSGTSPFVCPECGKCFTQKTDLSKHYRSHTGERPFSCSECGKSFTRNRGLLLHQKLHARKSSFPCKKCGICFIQQRDLNEHQRLHNSGCS